MVEQRILQAKDVSIFAVVVLHDPFRGMGAPAADAHAWRNSTEIQQSGHVPRSGPEVKMEEVVPKMARRRGSDAGQSRRSIFVAKLI